MNVTGTSTLGSLNAGNTTLNNATITNDLTINGNFTTYGNFSPSSLSIYGDLTSQGSLSIGDSADFLNGIDVSGDTNINTNTSNKTTTIGNENYKNDLIIHTKNGSISINTGSNDTGTTNIGHSGISTINISGITGINSSNLDTGGITIGNLQANNNITFNSKSGTININSDSADTGIITIGNSINTTNLYGTTNINSTPGNTGAISIGNTTGGNITITQPTAGTITLNNLSTTNDQTTNYFLVCNSSGVVKRGDTLLNNAATKVVLSTLRKKENIRKFIISKEEFAKLIPVMFKYKKEFSSNQRDQIGFIAEDVDKLETLKCAVVYDTEGRPEALDYQSIFAALVQQYLETCKEIEEQKNEIKDLKNELLEIKKIISK